MISTFRKVPNSSYQKKPTSPNTFGLHLVDKSKKMYVRIKLSEDRKYWERWVSSDKRSWELSSKLKSLTQVLESQQELIDSNYKNLFNVILKK